MSLERHPMVDALVVTSVGQSQAEEVRDQWRRASAVACGPVGGASASGPAPASPEVPPADDALTENYRKI
ncbi:hypothetical protein GCM10022214_29960 [Actinomadura miaoliensis]|uniref:Uncharacterized protein n=1 Tax=Actinomadura miaoliensis TaxID=430685 RepID=A0ABP7VQV7_9ACTN